MRKIIIAYDETPSGEDALVFGRRLCGVLDAKPVIAAAGKHSLPSKDHVYSNNLGHSPTRGLRMLAEEIRPLTMVVGSESDVAFGRRPGASRRLLRRVRCPIVVPAAGTRERGVRFNRLCVAVDHGPSSDKALTEALAIARLLGVGLTAVHIEKGRTGQSHQIVERLRESISSNPAVETVVIRGEPGPELADLSKAFDLTILGSGDKGPVGRALLGSVSAYLTGHVRGAMMVIPRKTPLKSLISGGFGGEH